MSSPPDASYNQHLIQSFEPARAALRSWEERVFLGVPVIVLTLAYAGIAASVGAVWPGAALVHESGRRTLVQTVFWFEHAVREIPIDMLLGAAIAGSLLRFWPTAGPIHLSRRRRVMRLTGGLTLALTAFIVTGALVGSGPVVVRQEFAQMHTRPDAPPGLGNHWDTHLLSRFALMLAAALLVGTHAALTGETAGEHERAPVGARLYRASLIAFFIGTVLLVPNVRPFVDTVHLGHQARELFTHLLVTVPVSYGAGLLVLRSLGGTRSETTTSASMGPVPAHTYAAGVGLALIGIYLTVGFLMTQAYGHGQSNSVVSLVLVHFFEHGLTYLFTPLWTIFLCAWMADRCFAPGSADSRAR